MAEIIVGRVVFKFQPRPNGDYLDHCLLSLILTTHVPHSYSELSRHSNEKIIDDHHSTNTFHLITHLINKTIFPFQIGNSIYSIHSNATKLRDEQGLQTSVLVTVPADHYSESAHFPRPSQSTSASLPLTSLCTLTPLPSNSYPHPLSPTLTHSHIRQQRNNYRLMTFSMPDFCHNFDEKQPFCIYLSHG